MPTRKMPFVPPGGFAGFAQQTAAVQSLIGGAGRKKTTRKKTRRKKTATRKSPTRRKRAATKKRGKRTGRLVKGSAAAKRRMAQLRKMRKG